MLASDLNNPDFAGPVNPDSKLAVQFYSRPVQNMYKTEQEGRPIFEDRDYIKIFIPGDATTVIDTPVRADHKARFPLQWAHYQNQGGEAHVGTPLNQWPLLSASQAQELRALKFFTVESIAQASDSQLQSIRMVAGMAPEALRDRASLFLKAATDNAFVQHQQEALAKSNEELAQANARIAALEEQMKPKRRYTKRGHQPPKAHAASV